MTRYTPSVRIFISYASERRALADRIAIGLRQSGAEVFFDRDALPPGEAYDSEIREQIRRSDLLIFLVSPESLEPGTYALTELGLARERWPNPSGRVLPVLVAQLKEGQGLPAYLSAVGILSPAGNTTAEVLAAVEALRGRRRRRLLLTGGATVGAAAVVALGIGGGPIRPVEPSAPPERPPPCLLTAQLRPSGADPGARPSGPVLVVTTSGGSNTLVFSDSGRASFEVPVIPGQGWLIELHDSRGISFGKLDLAGCPEAAVEREVDHGQVLTVQRRAPP